MDYYIYKNNENIGPLSEVEVAARLRSRQFLSTDLGCRVGDSDWKDLGFFFPIEIDRPSIPGSFRPLERTHNQSLVPVHQPAVVVLPPKTPQRFGGMSDAGKIMLFESSKKSATTAVVLCIFFGALGVHRFYLGRSGSGAAMLGVWLGSWLLMTVLIGFLTIWITPIWAFVDLFLISGIARQYNEELALRLGVF